MLSLELAKATHNGDVDQVQRLLQVRAMRRTLQP